MHAELEQLRKGIYQTLQFELLTISYPNEVWGMLTASDDFKVTPAFLCDSFSVQYSCTGSNNRTKEETIVLYWNEYIFNCPSTTGTVSVGDVMKFISGSSSVPATGFDKIPSIKFTDVDSLPTVSTCDVSITFRRWTFVSGDLMGLEKSKPQFCSILFNHIYSQWLFLAYLFFSLPIQ